MNETALITGVNGQDGAYLAQLLLEKGYDVYGAIRSPGEMKLDNLDILGITNKVKIVPFELLDYANILHVITKVKPDEVYSLAAMSFVALSFEEPFLTSEVTGMGPLRLLEALRTVNPKTKFFQASTSAMFDTEQKPPQTEKTPFRPKSPYAVAKLFAHCSTVNYRESYGMFACTGILYNHESPLRGLDFVTRKITHAVAKIKLGKEKELRIGNMNIKRDWGYAPEYVDAMWRTLQHPAADDYVIGSGKAYSVREFIEMAFKVIGISLMWKGKGVDEVGIDKKTGKKMVVVEPQFFRPAETDNMLADYSKAQKKLGWEPRVGLSDIVEKMVRYDLKILGTSK